MTTSKSDPEWPQIKWALVEKVENLSKNFEAFKTISEIKEKTYQDLAIAVQKNVQVHQDILYGFMGKDGEWKPGVIQLLTDYENRRKKLEKKFNWVGTGILTAIGASLWEVLSKLGKFFANSSGGH